MRSAQDYWRQNVNLLLKCMVVWFVCSYLFGIILFEELNAISLGGYKLGFWFAQQGSINIFLIIIYYYVRRMNALDREFDVDEK